VVLGVVFAIQNTMSAEVRSLWWQAQRPLAAAALLLGIPEVLGSRWRIRSLERRLGDHPPKDARPPEERSDEPPGM